MSDLFLDLHDKPRVVDFIADYGELAAPKERAHAEELVHAYQEGKKVPTDRLANAARKLAIAVWPARYALDKYFKGEGAADEWKRVTAAVRPSTAHLLKRFRQGTTAVTLDEVLKHDDAATAFAEGDLMEIDQVRHQARQDFWRDKRKTLEIYVKEGEGLMADYAERLGCLRELAVNMPKGMQDEVFSKLNHMEDRILFNGEAMPMETLDEEVKYYTDQKEISPME